MRVYKDFTSGEDLYTDTIKVELIEDLYFIVTGKYVTRSESGQFDIGANPSAEGGDEEEGVEGTTTTGIDVVMDSNLQECPFEKFKEYQVASKKCMQAMLERAKEEQGENFNKDKYVEKITNFFTKFLKPKFKQLTFYKVPSFNEASFIIPCEHVGDDEIPTFYFLKDAVLEEKV